MYRKIEVSRCRRVGLPEPPVSGPPALVLAIAKYVALVASGMYGWRGKLGLVVPSSNTTNEPEFHHHLPDGVSLHTSRMYLEVATAEELTEMAREIDRCARLLRTAEVDVIAYGCTTGSLVEGTGYDVAIEDQLSDAAGVPAVATAASIQRAFNALSVTAVAVATPYEPDLTRKVVEFLEAAGYEVVDSTGLGLTRNTEIGQQTPETAYQQAQHLDTTAADGVFISCTNYPTFPAIDPLERDLGLPVVTSNQATLWDALSTLEIHDAPDSLGRLFHA